jgi:2-polyprenyl-6-methoxyphenol hydroxylase-like FAD-dependent oxidoreductase
MDCDVLVCGAGPTGLVLALWLTRQGVRVRIIDRTAEPGTTSRALAVQARTLELYRQLDLAEAVVQRGQQVPALNLWARGERAAQVPLRSLGEGLTRYPMPVIFPQDEHERLLIERLATLGVAVERRTELIGFTEQGEQVVAQLRGPDGVAEPCAVRYLAGCDGARSLVRERLGTGFPGGTYRQVFYVADIDGSGPPVNGELHVDLDEADFLAVFPLAGAGRARLIGTVHDERAEHPENLRFEDVSGRAIENMQLTIERVNWFSTYRVHHRVTEHFRSGRVFLLGDAAHIHSPVGGQGMNTGIGDAINLAWKLAAVLAGRASATLLDSFEVERMRFARRLVATTDRVFTFVNADGHIAEIVRTRLAPFVLSRVLALEAAREFLFRTISQLTLNYRDMPLSEGGAGRVQGGDRLPWVAYGGGDNFVPLRSLRWQVHVYGSPPEGLSSACAQRRLPLEVLPFAAPHAAAGLERDALYLIRPDGYVALAQGRPDAAGLERYFAARGLLPAGQVQQH